MLGQVRDEVPRKKLFDGVEAGIDGLSVGERIEHPALELRAPIAVEVLSRSSMSVPSLRAHHRAKSSRLRFVVSSSLNVLPLKDVSMLLICTGSPICVSFT